ncbi:MAG: hypothetical protein ACE5FA_14470, partial [Dehalococcoidia bacterium]
DQPDFCFNLGSRSGDVIIGDIDCDDDIDAIDQLGILRDVAELLPLLQNEPCPDIGILLD